jgi:hypothetical protein
MSERTFCDDLKKEPLIAAVNHELLEAEEYWTCKMCEIAVYLYIYKTTDLIVYMGFIFIKNLNMF